MVQSVCLTSRGSGVRLPLLPPHHPKGHIQKQLQKCDCFFAVSCRRIWRSAAGKTESYYQEKIFRSERPVCRENFVNSAPMGNMAAARPYRFVVHLPYNLCFTCYIIDL